MSAVAVIVPVGPDDVSWHGLIDFLTTLPTDWELLFAGCTGAPEDWPPPRLPKARWLVCQRGRAAQLNAGARATTAPFIWWLHADSQPQRSCLQALQQALAIRPDALHWFGLRLIDGPALAALNAAGANWRSRHLGLPFGDQGLCLSRRRFEQIGGYDEGLALGEDLALVLRLRRLGVPLNEVPAWIASSARRYRRHGWLRTTLRHLYLTWRLSKVERSRHGN